MRNKGLEVIEISHIGSFHLEKFTEPKEIKPETSEYFEFVPSIEEIDDNVAIHYK